MAAQILALLNRALPIGLATKGISKVNPRIGSFVQGALGSGFTTDQVFGFLRDKLEGTSSAAERARLEAGERAGTLRPDERAAREEIGQSRRAGDFLQTAAGLGAGVLGGISGMRQAEEAQQMQEKEAQMQAQQKQEAVQREIQRMELTKRAQDQARELAEKRMTQQQAQFDQRMAQNQARQQAVQSSQSQAQQAQQAPDIRKQAADRLNEMKKHKKLIEDLQEDFERRYGQAAPARQEFPGRQQGGGDANDEQLLALMQNILKS